MRKKISEMTEQDKASFLKATIRATETEQGVSWGWMEARIRSEIDATFDDEKFVKMDPDSRIDAAFARKEFGDAAPGASQFVSKDGVFFTLLDPTFFRLRRIVPMAGLLFLHSTPR